MGDSILKQRNDESNAENTNCSRKMCQVILPEYKISGRYLKNLTVKPNDKLPAFYLGQYAVTKCCDTENLRTPSVSVHRDKL